VDGRKEGREWTELKYFLELIDWLGRVPGSTSYHRSVRPLRFPRLLVTFLSAAFKLPEPGGNEKIKTNQLPRCGPAPARVTDNAHPFTPVGPPHARTCTCTAVQLHRLASDFLALSSRKPSFSRATNFHGRRQHRGLYLPDPRVPRDMPGQH
jgi:hypothetical protein